MDQTPSKPSQIRVGAGLEESRLNQDFLDFLRKWSTPILFVAALAALGFVGWQKYTQHKLDSLDKAFRELEDVSSTATPSPDSLAAVARQYAGVAAVSAIANNRAADSLMFSLQTGLKAGAKLNADGSPEIAGDLLSDADRATVLTQAAEHYQHALDDSSSKPAQRPLTYGALFGLATVAESRGDLDAARGYYDRIIALVDADPPITLDEGKPAQKPFAMHAAVARKRIESLGELRAPLALVSEAQLPKLPPLPEPPAPASGMEGGLPPGMTLPPGVTVEPVGPPTPVPPEAAPFTPAVPPAQPSTVPPQTPPAPPAEPK
jgi:hypothetical protein